MGKCFFSFLRMGEVVVPSALGARLGFDPQVHLSRGDIWVDSRANPSYLRFPSKR